MPLKESFHKLCAYDTNDRAAGDSSCVQLRQHVGQESEDIASGPHTRRPRAPTWLEAPRDTFFALDTITPTSVVSLASRCPPSSISYQPSKHQNIGSRAQANKSSTNQQWTPSQSPTPSGFGPQRGLNSCFSLSPFSSFGLFTP